MTRYDLLLSAYQDYDTIYLALIMISVWAAGTSHLLDWLTERRGKILVSIFWSLIVLVYIAGIIFIGLKYST